MTEAATATATAAEAPVQYIPTPGVEANVDVMSPQFHRDNFWKSAEPHITRGKDKKVVSIDSWLKTRIQVMKDTNKTEAALLRVGAGNAETRFYVHNATIGLIEAAKSGMIEGLSPQTQAVFNALGDRQISRTAAPYLVPAIEALLESGAAFSTGGGSKTEFEQRYDELRKLSPIIATQLRIALKSAIHKGEIQIEGFDEKFPMPERTPEIPEGGQAPATSGRTDGARPDQSAPERESESDPATEEENTARGRAESDYNNRMREIDATLSKAINDDYMKIVRLRDTLSDTESERHQKRNAIVTNMRTRGPSLNPTSEELELYTLAGINVSDLRKLATTRAELDRQFKESTARFKAFDWDVRDSVTEKEKVTEAARNVGSDLAQAYVDATHIFKADLKFETGKLWKDFFEQVTHPVTGKKIWVFKDERTVRKAFQKTFVEEPLYRYFERIDSNTSTTYRDLFNAFTHGRYLEHVMGLMNDLSRELKQGQDVDNISLGDDDVSTKIRESLLYTESMINYGSSLQNYGQLFHDLPIFANDPSSIEKWAGILAALPASQQAQFFDDPVIEVARSVYSRHLKSRLALNGNEIPSNILGGANDQNKVIYQIPDIQEFKRDLENTFKERHRQRIAKLAAAGIDTSKMKLEVSDWEISRAVTYARGIGLLNLTDAENLGTGNMANHFRGIPDIIAQVVQRHKWNQGRGGPKNPLLPELLAALKVHTNPMEKSVFARLWDGLSKTQHDPVAIRRIAEHSLKAMGEAVNFDLVDEHASYMELMNMFNIGSLYTRAGWRVEHLLGYNLGKPEQQLGHEGIKSAMKVAKLNWGKRDEWEQGDWVNFYDIITQQVGSGALWFYAGKRNEESGKAGAYIERYFHKLHHDKKIKVTPNISVHDAFAEAFHGKRTFVPTEIKVWGRNAEGYEMQKETLFMIHEMQVNQARGEMLERLRRRSPGDYLMTVLQMAPELMTIYKDESEGVWGTATKDSHGEKLHSVINRRNVLQNRFGDHGMFRLRQMRAWIEQAESTYMNDDRFLKIKDPVEKRRAIMNVVIADLGMAFENLREIDERRKDPKLDAGPLDLDASHMPVKYDAAGNPDMRLTNLVFGPDKSSFMNIFRYDAKGNLTIADKDFGDYDRINEHNFNYLLARAWTDTNAEIIPTTTDIDNLQIYGEIAGAGETVIKRLIGDLPAWNEVASKLMGLDKLIEHAGKHGDLEEIYELCGEIHDLRTIIGLEQAERAVFYVASMVASYMWETDLARAPFIVNTPVGAAIKTALGDRISLSRLRFGPTAHSMDSNAIRTMFKELSFDAGILGIKGRWSYQHAKETFKATDKQFVLGEVAWQGTALVIGLILYFYLKKAMEENSGGGGGGGGGHGGGHH